MFGFFAQALKLIFFGTHHDNIIRGRLAADHTVHGQQASCLFYGEPPVGAGLDVEMRYPSCFFIKEIQVSWEGRSWFFKLMRLLTSAADNLQECTPPIASLATAVEPWLLDCAPHARRNSTGQAVRLAPGTEG